VNWLTLFGSLRSPPSASQFTSPLNLQKESYTTHDALKEQLQGYPKLSQTYDLIHGDFGGIASDR
jgi:hypothetical protein